MRPKDKVSEILGQLRAKQTPTSTSASEDPRHLSEDPWSRVHREARDRHEGLYGYLLWLDDALVRRGWPAVAPWWMETLRDFWASQKRWLLLRVGRRGGKSSTLCRVAVIEALFSRRQISPGDVGVWAIFSVDRAEASGRLTTIKAILTALSVDHTTSSYLGRERVSLPDAYGNPIEFRVYPATVGAASGFTAIGATCDEEAKWKDEKTGSNPAAEVLRALRPALATLEGAHGYRCSSAFGEQGTHYQDVERGDTDLHHVAKLGESVYHVREDLIAVSKSEDEQGAEMIIAHAEDLTKDSASIPTWISNPTKTARGLRVEEPDLATWLREYASKSLGSSGSSFFDGYRLSQALEIDPPPHAEDGDCHAAIDTGSKANACALAIVSSKKGFFTPVYLREWIPAPGNPLDLDRVVLPEMAGIARDRGCQEWHTDTFYGPSVELRGGECGLTTHYVSSDAFEALYEPVRRALNRGQLALKGCEELVRQLRLVRATPGEGGKMKITIPLELAESGTVLHGDLGVAFVRAAAAAGAGCEEDREEGRIEGLPGRYAEEVSDRSAR